MMSVNVIIPNKGIGAVLINGLLFSFLIFATIVSGKYNKKFKYIYFYIIFLFLLVLLQSSNHQYSFTNLIKYSMGLLCLPLGFNILSSQEKFRDFQRTGIYLLLLYLINVLFANIFHWGDFYGYEIENGLEIGNVFSDGLYLNVYVITSIFLLIVLYPLKKHKYTLLLVLAICAILIIVNMKRMVILLLLVGLISYIFFHYFNNGFKSKLSLMQFKYLTLFLILALIVLPMFYPYIQRSFETREKKFEKSREDIMQEGRMLEFKYISEEIVQFDDISTFLFGKETFNLVGTYGGGLFGNRPIHGDYSKLLHGTGVAGVLFWLCIHLHLIIWIVRLKKSVYTKTDALASIIFPLYFSFIIIYCLSMMSGVMGCVISSSFFYASLGGMLRYFFNKRIFFLQCKDNIYFSSMDINPKKINKFKFQS